MSTAYLDNNATTKVDPRVVEAMLPFFTEQFGNASSIHEFGAQVTGALRKARKQAQTLLGAEFDQRGRLDDFQHLGIEPRGFEPVPRQVVDFPMILGH